MLYSHKRFEEEKVKKIASEETVLDVGGGERFTKWLKKYKHLFAQTTYKTLDPDPATRPDIVGDIHMIPLEDGSVGGVICYSTLEHVRDPTLAMRELRRILTPGGKLLLYVPSIYPYHARTGHYPDYWRFFEDTLKEFFRDWSHYEIQKVGGYFKAMSFFVPFQHKLRGLLDPAALLLDTAFAMEKRTTTSGYIVYAVK